ncbi:HAD family phosphatase [Citrobacter freundii]|uniref:HAD family hydrolase n=1 Tax=Citrobacter freundii TaxID=546 RepID=UPI0024DEF9B7|nr:HAD family phosphatase [Citrobacter freundii]MDK2357688.1 HAD family phosphatase [Citrobacter freundii]
MTQIRAVVFDMDGVLIDARDWHYQALNQILAMFGVAINHQDHLLEFDGLPTKDKLTLLTKRYGLPESLHPFINEMKQRYTMQLIHQHCWPVFEHQLTLAWLRRQGYQVAVASNSIRDSIETMMGRAQLLPYLNFFLSNEDVTCGKPDPEIYNKAFQILGITPAECVIVEDNPHGIMAAKASGAHVLSVKEPKDVTRDLVRTFINQCESIR